MKINKNGQKTIIVHIIQKLNSKIGTITIKLGLHNIKNYLY